MIKAAFSLLAALALTVPALAENAPHYSVTVSLSPSAKQKLTSMGEAITVAAYYEGEPAPGVQTEDGTYGLGGEEALVPGEGGTAQLGGTVFKASELKKIKGEPELLINVYSARKASDDNLLDCDLWQDGISKIPSGGIAIACKLIGER